MESDENDLDNLFEEHDTEERTVPEEVANNNEFDTNNVDENQSAVRVPAPKRAVKNPRLKFNPDRLCGERGIPILIKHFKDVKFKGKGYEVEDLNKLMSSLEHWCHRLFPSMTFADCLKQIEKLGKKRPVQTCLRKIRLDMPILHSDFVRDDEDENPENIQEELDVEIPPQDAFDRLFNEVNASEYAHLASTPLPVKRPSLGQALGTSFGSTLTEEQKKRMEYNKLLATERRKAKLQAMQSDTAASLNESAELFPSQVPSTQDENEEVRIMDENSSSKIPNLEVLNKVSKKSSALLNSHYAAPQSPSIINSNTEQLGLDDLIDLVDEDDEPQITDNDNRKNYSPFKNIDAGKNNRKVEVIHLANKIIRTSNNIEIVDLEKNNARVVNSITRQPIEIIDLDNLANNKQIDVIDLDATKSNNVCSKNDNLDLINIDCEDEPANKKAGNSKNIEVVDLEKDSTRIVNSLTSQPIEIIDLNNLASDKQIEAIDLDFTKSNNVHSKNDNLDLINIDCKEEPAAKRFKTDKITVQEQENVPYDDLHEKDNSDIIEMETDDIHSLSSANTIDNSNINPLLSKDVVD